MIRKGEPIAPAAETQGRDGPHYGADLATFHHARFGDVARAAAAELTKRLSAAGFARGRVVDLGAGSGILCRHVVDAGFQAFGVDLSAAMLRIAHKVVPEAKFVRSSLWSTDLPGGPGEMVAVTAVGEALSYATDAGAGLPGLRDLLAAIHCALTPGGLLLFDVAGPGRGGPDGYQERTFVGGPTLLLLDEREDRANGVLTRALTTFTMLGRRFRRSDETHRLVLYEPERIEELLAATGFAWERLAGYEGTEPLPGWHVFLARKPG